MVLAVWLPVTLVIIALIAIGLASTTMMMRRRRATARHDTEAGTVEIAQQPPRRTGTWGPTRTPAGYAQLQPVPAHVKRPSRDDGVEEEPAPPPYAEPSSTRAQ